MRALGAATLLLSAIVPPLHDDKATLSSGEATLFASSALPTLALVNREQASRCWQSCSAVSLSGLAPGFESLEGPFFYVGSLHERPVYSTTQGAIAPAPGTFFLSWFADERYAHSGGFWKIGPDYGTDGYLLGALSESTCPPAKWTAGNAASGGTTMSCRDVSPSLPLPTAEEARPRLLQEVGTGAGVGTGVGAGAGVGAPMRAPPHPSPSPPSPPLPSAPPPLPPAFPPFAPLPNASSVLANAPALLVRSRALHRASLHIPSTVDGHVASARLPTLPCRRDAWPGLPSVQVTLHFASSSSLLTSTSIAPLIYGAANCSQHPKCRVDTDHHMIDSFSKSAGRDGGDNTGSYITVCDGDAMKMRWANTLV